jgi:pyrimidine-specific ribonucleoside hydrolase
MPPVIVETDLGHDPDDLFALCYLAAAGTEIAAVTVVPGDPDQLAVARLLAKVIGRDIPVGASKLGRTKPSSGGVHHRLLDHFGVPRAAEPDGSGEQVIADALALHPDAEFVIIGPCTSTARYLARPDAVVPRRVTLQGGFLGYHLHSPAIRLPEFEGKEWMPMFNLNGDRRAAQVVLAAPVADRRFVGKNVCHTVVYDRAVHETMPPPPPDNPAAALFRLAMDLYLEVHPGKKWHDPTAAVCHRHPGIGSWVRGRATKLGGGWGTVADEGGDRVLADVDRAALWVCFRTWT